GPVMAPRDARPKGPSRAAGAVLAALVLLCFAAACQVPPATPEPGPSPTAPSATPTAPALLQPPAQEQAAALLPQFLEEATSLREATRYAITATLMEEARLIVGQASIYYTNTEAVPLEELVLRLYPNLMGADAALTLESSQVGGRAVPPHVRQDGSAAHLPLDPPLPPGRGITVTLSFRTHVASHGARAYGAFGVQGGIWTLAGFYPLVAVYDEPGWNEEIPAEHGDMVHSDIAFYRVVWQAPEGYVLAATGSVVGEDERDGTHTWTLVSGPVREFNLALSRDYQVATREAASGVRLRSFHLPERAAAGEATLQYAQQAMDLYESLFGPYPYRELDLAEAEIGAAGIEYPGFILVAQSLYAREDPFLEFVVAHEVAHQWWYNLVGNDQVEEPWLDEALANYSTVLYFGRVHGPDAADALLEAFRQRYEDLVQQGRDAPIAQPATAFSPADYGPIVYQKGALFLDALRAQMGDQAFLALLRQYQAQYRYRIAHGRDFQRVAESVAGRDLGPFFSRWLYGVRLPGG
ncbi:MAG: hypothetical protein H5T59_11825, partial [Anaerolineae bacterium]|nr:hypothetical protein [Anaerolineae bacterium]